MTRSRDDIRRDMRVRRRLVTRRQRSLAAQRFLVAAESDFLLRPGRRIAVYHPYGHEADVGLITQRAWQRQCFVYVPVIVHAERFTMHFAPYRRDARLELNVFGIPEPVTAPGQRILPLQLDLIFMPLVAFDTRGWRLGSGAGFYDRSLRHLRGPRRWRRPKLVGVAYEHQRIDVLEPGRWDIPMDAVLTEQRIHRFASHSAGNEQ